MLFNCCSAAILIRCSVRDWTRIDYVIGFENIRVHPSTRSWIRSGFIFFHSGERIQKCQEPWAPKTELLKMSGFAVDFAGCERPDGSRIRKDIKLWIQKYPENVGPYSNSS